MIKWNFFDTLTVKMNDLFSKAGLASQVLSHSEGLCGMILMVKTHIMISFSQT